MNYVGKYIYIDLKTCIGLLPVPSLAKGGLYRKLLKECGTAFPRAKVLECNSSDWKVLFDNGVEGFIPKSYYLEVPPGVTFEG
jgi:hypothetical protein